MYLDHCDDVEVSALLCLVDVSVLGVEVKQKRKISSLPQIFNTHIGGDCAVDDVFAAVATFYVRMLVKIRRGEPASFPS